MNVRVFAGFSMAISEFSQKGRSQSISIYIYLAGDFNTLRRAALDFCSKNGFCVTVTPTEYVYKYGFESGAIVGVINYPRFPEEQDELERIAQMLAEEMALSASQGSYTIQTPNETRFYSRRDGEGRK